MDGRDASIGHDIARRVLRWGICLAAIACAGLARPASAESLSEALASIIRSPRLRASVEPLLGPDVGLFHVKFIMKSPQVGGLVPWHQDYAYWTDQADAPLQLNCMVYLDDADEQNGCLQVLAGKLTVGELLIFLAYLAQLYEPLNQLSHVGATVAGAVVGTQRVFEILDTPEEVKDAPNARPVIGARATKGLTQPAGQAHLAHGAIEFDRVSFSYQKASRSCRR